MGKYKTTPIGKFLADYLVAWGVLRRNELGAANARLGTVDVSQNAWQLFQTGQAICTLLVRLDLAQRGVSELNFQFTAGADAESLFNNWDKIDDHLSKQYGMQIGRKDLCMICSGAKGPVEEVLNKLRSRTEKIAPPDKLQQLDADGDGRVDAPASSSWDFGDRTDQVLALVATLSTAYRMILASLLLVFTPQQCGIAVCTQRQNIENAFRVAKPVIFVNFGTLLIFCLGELVVYIRERFVINSFAVDHTLPDDHIEEEIEFYPKLKHKLRVLTSNCYVVSFFMSLLLLGNFGYSVYVLRVKLQAPLETIIQVVGNVLLISGKVWGYFLVSRAALNKPGSVVSLTLKEPKESNTIDDEFKGKVGWYVRHEDPKLVAVK